MKPHARNPTALKAGHETSFSSGNPTPSNNEARKNRNFLPLLPQTPVSHRQEPMADQNHGPPGSGSNFGIDRSRLRHELNNQDRSDSTIRRTDAESPRLPGRSEPILRSLQTVEESIASTRARKQEEREKIRARRQKDKERAKELNQQKFREQHAMNSTSRDDTDLTTNLSSSLGGSGSSNSSSSNSSYSYQGNRHSPSPPPPPRQCPLPINDWRARPEIQVRVSGLPMQYKTLDVYETFQQFGVIEAIKLFENTHGTRDGAGEVKFSHVYKSHPFWIAPIRYLWRGVTQEMTARLLPLPQHKFIVTTEANKNIEYPDRFIFKPKRLDFGLMVEENVFMGMHTIHNVAEDIVFEVNLFRKQIDVKFKIYHAKEDGSISYETPLESGQSTPNQDKRAAEAAKDRWESYRFQIPFSQLGQILEYGPRISEESRTLLISLPSPPLFWRELFNVASSHDPTANYWSSFDKWFRQTGIAFDQVDRSTSPVSLKQKNPIIDTGRWTTYRVQFGLERSQISCFGQMLLALKDFNVKTVMLDLSDTPQRLTHIWDTIDAKSTNSHYGGLMAAVRPLLPYPTRYQLEVCISRNFLNEYNITTEFIDKLLDMNPENAVRLLEHVAENEKRRFYNPMDIFDLTVKGGTAALLKKLEGDYQRVRKASVTPSTVYYATPTVETTNRVIRHYRHYSDRFLRVQFVDEFKGRINSTHKNSMNEVFTRIMTALAHGITIGGEHFEFLAFGNSQIREHGAYFFASDEHVSVRDIRKWMGKFKSIRIVAKHAARLGQCFSTTRAIRGVQVDVVDIPDIEHPDNEYNFSDGVGKISEFLASLISMELKLPQDQPPPSCFQFRLGGCKGVLTVWPDAKQREVHIRPSQEKFKAKHKILEVIRCSQPATACLNRQLIIVLSSLGASDHVFIDKLEDTLQKYADAMVRPAAALYLLYRVIDANQFTFELASMVSDGFMEAKEPFVVSLLSLWRAWSIKYLKEKARIMVENGAFVLGVVDETGILKGHYDDEDENDKVGGKNREKKKEKRPPTMPEIFLQISDPEHPGQFRVIEGLCLVARNPSLHPGDIRTVRAVDIPELRHLRNVVVFPSKGDRDLASMLSGGDLDGDDYIVIWDKDLTSGITNYPPMDYLPMEPIELSRDVEVNDITKFFVNYMKNDKLGAIANSHLAWADYLEEGVKSDQCLALAALHSDAVDYVKTGVPADMPRSLRIRKYPHFMEKEKEKSYTSYKILGQLYDKVQRIDFVPSYELSFDERILNAYTPSEEMLEAARELKGDYDSALHSIMAQHEIHTEFEVYSTFVMHHSQAAGDYKFHEEIGNIRDGLKEIWQKAVIHRVGSNDELELGPFVVAMYTVTKQELDAGLDDLKARKAKGRRRERYVEGMPLEFTPEDVKAMPLISFPWLFARILGKIAKREYPFNTEISGQTDVSEVGCCTKLLQILRLQRTIRRIRTRWIRHRYQRV
ncbi:RNA dependent RNA polymerase-domain-containing protein [Morchella snyderi]|nr:RNA dependent RNA polymerase-domain-containing protein [Morchella snyderi]